MHDVTKMNIWRKQASQWEESNFDLYDLTPWPIIVLWSEFFLICLYVYFYKLLWFFFYSTCSDVMRFDWGPRGDTELLRGCVHEYIHLLYDCVLQTTSQGQERIDVYIYIFKVTVQCRLLWRIFYHWNYWPI